MRTRIQSYLLENIEQFLVLAILIATLLINSVFPQKSPLLNFFYLLGIEL